MISRLTLLAALFAVIGTASLGVAANARIERDSARAAMPVIVFEKVTVIGRRTP
jgi:hypothetical protein